MADQGLVAGSAFSTSPSLSGQGFSARARETLTMASFAAAKGRVEDLALALKAAYGVELPKGAARVEGRDIAFVWMGPGQWLAMAERGAEGRDLEVELKARLQDAASVVDQSDGRVVVRVGGAQARHVLAKGLPIDLHPRAFKPGDAAITHASHIGVLVWQLDEQPTFELAMFRSYADSFLHWLEDAAKELGAKHV